MALGVYWGAGESEGPGSGKMCGPRESWKWKMGHECDQNTLYMCVKFSRNEYNISESSFSVS